MTKKIHCNKTKTKLEYLQIDETDLQSEITNVRSDGDVLISKEIQLS